MTASLTFRGVTKTWPGGRRALDAIDLQLQPGITALLGPNGAGKTTLLRVTDRSEKADTGSIECNGLRAANTAAWRDLLGIQTQAVSFPPPLSGRDVMNLAMLRSGCSPRASAARIDWLLDAVGLLGDADRMAAHYSGGMKRRLAIAMAFVADPPIVLLDEPTTGLDPVERLRAYELLRHLAADRVIIMSTHIVADVEACADSIAVLAQGKCRFHGTPGELIRHARGITWTVAVDTVDDAAAWLESGRLVELTPRDGAFVARVLSTESPASDSQQVEPTIAGAYVHLVGREAVAPAEVVAP